MLKYIIIMFFLCKQSWDLYLEKHKTWTLTIMNKNKHKGNETNVIDDIKRPIF